MQDDVTDVALSLPISVLIVDDQTIVRQGIASMLATEERIHIVGEGASGQEAISLAAELDPDIILLDIRMPGMDGLTAARTIKQSRPEQHIIMLTLNQSQEYLRQAIQNGATGYVLKDVGRQGLIDAIMTVANGGALIESTMLRDFLLEMATAPIGDSRAFLAPDSQSTTAPFPEGALDLRLSRTGAAASAPGIDLAASAVNNLTRREREVLALLGSGKSNRAIADSLFISLDTVKSHVRAILDKLDLRDRTQAAIWAVRVGLTEERNRNPT